MSDFHWEDYYDRGLRERARVDDYELIAYSNGEWVIAKQGHARVSGKEDTIDDAKWRIITVYTALTIDIDITRAG